MNRILCFIGITAALAMLCACSVQVGTDGEGSLRFACGDRDVETALTMQETQEIAAMFDGKSLYFDGSVPSCGFSEAVSVTIDGQIFCIAQDTCATVYMNGRGYFDIRAEENVRLRTIMERYGCYFPCI